jgi:hypothetical protein
MKLLFIPVSLAAFILTSSCSKPYTCQCNSSWTGGKVDVDIKARNDNAAKTECYNLYRDFYDAPTDCRLK